MRQRISRAAIAERLNLGKHPKRRLALAAGMIAVAVGLTSVLPSESTTAHRAEPSAETSAPAAEEPHLLGHEPLVESPKVGATEFTENTGQPKLADESLVSENKGRFSEAIARAMLKACGISPEIDQAVEVSSNGRDLSVLIAEVHGGFVPVSGDQCYRAAEKRTREMNGLPSVAIQADGKYQIPGPVDE